MLMNQEKEGVWYWVQFVALQRDKSSLQNMVQEQKKEIWKLKEKIKLLSTRGMKPWKKNIKIMLFVIGLYKHYNMMASGYEQLWTSWQPWSLICLNID
jgi:hypothetical protein